MTLQCPKCGGFLARNLSSKAVNPFEIAYECKKCDSLWVWNNWAEYQRSRDYEKFKRKQTEKKRISYNPSRRRSNG